MIYVVDHERIDRQLGYLAQCVKVLKEGEKQLDNLAQDLVLQFAMARALHLAVEAIIDIGDALITSYLMRDPGGYEDIIDILEDEQVIPSEATAQLKERVRLRERLVRHYEKVEVSELIAAIKNYEDLVQFPTWVANFMEREAQRSGFKGQENGS